MTATEALLASPAWLVAVAVRMLVPGASVTGIDHAPPAPTVTALPLSVSELSPTLSLAFPDTVTVGFDETIDAPFAGEAIETLGW